MHLPMSDTSDQRSDSVPVSTSVGPWSAYCLSSCAFAVTAYSLGAAWVATPWLGLPVGVWGIMAGFGVLGLTRARRFSAPTFALPNFAGSASSASSLLNRFRRGGAGGADRPNTSRDIGAAAPASRAERRSGATIIRIGLDLPADERELILDAAARFTPLDGVRFEWVTLNDNALEPGPEPRKRRWSDRLRPCDATLRRATGPGARAKPSLEVITPHHGSGAGWIDWGRPDEFNYAGVFPARLDPAGVSMGNTRVDNESAPAIAGLAAAAAALRRTAIFGTGAGMGLNASPAERAADEMILEAFRWAASSDGQSPARRVAARVGSAWIVGRGMGVAPGERVRLVEAAVNILPREPQLVLQSLASVVAAAGSGSGDSHVVDDAMVRAVNRLIELDERATVDPFPFVMSELELGSGDALALGRIAAGAAMLWSGVRGSSMKFLREDLLADIEHTGWLRQRPQMKALLARLVRGADRARNEYDREHRSAA